MQAKRANPKKSPQKINSYPNQLHDHDEGEFELMSESQESEYGAEESQTRQSHTGRR